MRPGVADPRHHRTLVEFEKLLWLANIQPRAQEAYSYLYAEATHMVELAAHFRLRKLLAQFSFIRKYLEDNLMLSTAKRGYRSDQLVEAIAAERGTVAGAAAFIPGRGPAPLMLNGAPHRPERRHEESVPAQEPGL